MRILVLGGTGAAGILVIEEALAANHIVVIFARSPEKLPAHITSHRDVIVIKGELTDSETISKAMEGVDAVLSVLGPSAWHPSDTPLAHGYRQVLEVMRQHSVKRLIALGTASIKDKSDKFTWTYSAFVWTVALFAHNAYKDIVAVGDAIRESEGVDWTIARVPLLSNDEKKDWVAGYLGDGKINAVLSRAALAAYMLQELQNLEWVKKAPMITSPR